MHTINSRKKSKTILVVLIVIIIPLIIFFLILLNTAPEQTGEKFHDKVKVGVKPSDTTGAATLQDTTNK